MYRQIPIMEAGLHERFGGRALGICSYSQEANAHAWVDKNWPLIVLCSLANTRS